MLGTFQGSLIKALMTLYPSIGLSLKGFRRFPSIILKITTTIIIILVLFILFIYISFCRELLGFRRK